METPSLPPSGSFPPSAPPSAAPAAADLGDQVCLFELMETRCAVPASQISQILEVETVTSVPLAPRHVVGVTFFENQILPLVELRSLAPRSKGQSEIAAVLDFEGERIGLLIEKVFGFRGVVAPDSQDATRTPSAQLQPFVEVVKRDGDESAFLLSVSRLIESLRPQAQGAV